MLGSQGKTETGIVKWQVRALPTFVLGHQPLHFDTTSTPGFEGEGPEPWALASFNVGSLETHSCIFENILPMYLLSKELDTLLQIERNYNMMLQAMTFHCILEQIWLFVIPKSNYGVGLPFPLDKAIVSSILSCLRILGGCITWTHHIHC